jgi:hypothetical protein
MRLNHLKPFHTINTAAMVKSSFVIENPNMIVFVKTVSGEGKAPYGLNGF